MSLVPWPTLRASPGPVGSVGWLNAACLGYWPYSSPNCRISPRPLLRHTKTTHTQVKTTQRHTTEAQLALLPGGNLWTYTAVTLIAVPHQGTICIILGRLSAIQSEPYGEGRTRGRERPSLYTCSGEPSHHLYPDFSADVPPDNAATSQTSNSCLRESTPLHRAAWFCELLGAPGFLSQGVCEPGKAILGVGGSENGSVQAGC